MNCSICPYSDFCDHTDCPYLFGDGKEVRDVRK